MLRGDYAHEAVGELLRPCVGDGTALTVARRRFHNRADPLVGEVIVELFKQLLPADDALQLYAGFDCCERIGDYRESRAVAAYRIQLRALRCVQSPLDRAFEHQIHYQLGRDLGYVIEMQIHSGRGDLDRPRQMLLIQLKKPRKARLRFAAQIDQRLLQDLGNVNFDRIVHRELASGHAHPVASDGDALAGGRFVHSVLHIALAERLISAEARPSVFVPEQIFYRQSQKFGVAVFMHADGQIAADVDHIRRVENQI